MCVTACVSVCVSVVSKRGECERGECMSVCERGECVCVYECVSV